MRSQTVKISICANQYLFSIRISILLIYTIVFASRNAQIRSTNERFQYNVVGCSRHACELIVCTAYAYLVSLSACALLIYRVHCVAIYLYANSKWNNCFVVWSICCMEQNIENNEKMVNTPLARQTILHFRIDIGIRFCKRGASEERLEREREREKYVQNAGACAHSNTTPSRLILYLKYPNRNWNYLARKIGTQSNEFRTFPSQHIQTIHINSLRILRFFTLNSILCYFFSALFDEVSNSILFLSLSSVKNWNALFLEEKIQNDKIHSFPIQIPISKAKEQKVSSRWMMEAERLNHSNAIQLCTWKSTNFCTTKRRFLHLLFVSRWSLRSASVKIINISRSVLWK